jgi:hypothetical protein
MIDESNYLDLRNLLVNELIGSAVLTFFIGVVILAIVGIKQRWPWQVTTLFCILWAATVYSGSGIQWLWAYVVFFVGLIAYFKYNQLMSRS